jgi:Preprotein translocase subunit Sec63
MCASPKGVSFAAFLIRGRKGSWAISIRPCKVPDFNSSGSMKRKSRGLRDFRCRADVFTSLFADAYLLAYLKHQVSYIRDVMFAGDEEKRKRWLVFLLDGHGSRFSDETLRWCNDNQVALFILPSNLTHLLQPADQVPPRLIFQC